MVRLKEDWNTSEFCINMIQVHYRMYLATFSIQVLMHTFSHFPTNCLNQNGGFYIGWGIPTHQTSIHSNLTHVLTKSRKLQILKCET